MAEIIERYLITVDETEYDLHLSRNGNNFIIEHNGDKYDVSVDKISGSKYLFKINAASSEVDISRNNGGLEVFLEGQEMEVTVEPFELAQLRKKVSAEGGPKEKFIRAPMPGLVLKTEVKKGEPVNKGDTLVIIEAMKMENMIKTPFDGIVKEVHVSPTQAVDKNALLIELE
jgi:biotin carboxyl carrier protein